MPEVATDPAQKLRAVKQDMRTTLVEREDEIDLVLMSVVSQQHGCFVGEPGVAKSLTLKEFIRRIEGVKTFEILLNQAMPPTEVLGQISVRGLTEDRYEHKTEGRLPEANLAFLDEGWKANAVTLNSMLGVLNERVFHNNGVVMPVPLWSAFIASNELPTDPVLAAVRDRFPWTKIVEPVKSDAGFTQIIRGNLDRRRGASGNSNATLTLDDIQELQQRARNVSVGDEFLSELVKLRALAETEGLRASARRFAAAVALCQAQAAIAGRTELAKGDLQIFQHVLWLDPDDIPVAREVVSEFAGRIAKVTHQFRSALDAAGEKFAAIKKKVADGDSDAFDGGIPLLQELKTVGNDLRSEVTRAQGEGEDASPLVDLEGSLKTLRDTVTAELLA
jgi:MoxR-like ATPase